MGLIAFTALAVFGYDPTALEMLPEFENWTLGQVASIALWVWGTMSRKGTTMFGLMRG